MINDAPALPAVAIPNNQAFTPYRPDSTAVDALLCKAGLTDDMLLLDEYEGKGASTTTGALDATTVTDAGCDRRPLDTTARLSDPPASTESNLQTHQLNKSVGQQVRFLSNDENVSTICCKLPAVFMCCSCAACLSVPMQQLEIPNCYGADETDISCRFHQHLLWTRLNPRPWGN